MEGGGVDSTVIECRQHLLGCPPFLTFSVFDLQKRDLPQLNLRPCGTFKKTYVWTHD